jgi:DNA-binding MarR family transcriptional regulator
MRAVARARRRERSLDPVLDFMRLLWRIEHGLQATSKRMEARLGITGPQRLALRIVSRFPGISAGDLARIVHLHPSTMAGIVHRLVDKGLLLRERDRDDSRRLHLRPGPRVKRFKQLASGTVEEAAAAALRRVPAARVRQARVVLEAIANALDRDAAPSRGSTAR